MIKKEQDGYHVYSEKGKHLGGPYSKKKAEERLRQIEYFKHKDESMSSIQRALKILSEETNNSGWSKFKGE